jgi:hypothetical protein
MYNVGFFIPKIDGSDLNVEIFENLNEALTSKEIAEAVVFYNDVEHNPVTPKFGMFNSTDIWFFTGTLISTSLDTCELSRSAVNKFKLYHLYNAGEKNLVGALHISQHVEFITTSPEDSKELYRITGKKPVLEVSGIKNLISRLGEL